MPGAPKKVFIPGTFRRNFELFAQTRFWLLGPYAGYGDVTFLYKKLVKKSKILTFVDWRLKSPFLLWLTQNLKAVVMGTVLVIAFF